MIKKIISLFIFWRISLFIISFFAVSLIHNFAGTFPYYDKVLQPTKLPEWIWGFGNFDGVHYLRIAQNGYDAEFSQAFFPLYPLIIGYLNFIPRNPLLPAHTFVDPGFFIIGIVIANIFFLAAILSFYKLIKIDFNNKVALGSIILLLAYPTSFYFGAVYTESLFLLLSIGSFYFMRKENFVLAGILAGLASATRILGLLLFPAILVEIFMNIKKRKDFNNVELLKYIFSILLTPFGIILYILYLKMEFNNPLYFLTSQPAFGAERTSGSLILLPQVIYRYIKIFMNVSIQSQQFFNAFLEFFFTVFTVSILLIFFKKMRLSYFLFTLGCLIIPTLTGTLSSMPRYSLMAFLILPYIVQSTLRYYKLLIPPFIGIGIILLSLFIRGYWVA